MLVVITVFLTESEFRKISLEKKKNKQKTKFDSLIFIFIFYFTSLISLILKMNVE